MVEWPGFDSLGIQVAVQVMEKYRQDLPEVLCMGLATVDLATGLSWIGIGGLTVGIGGLTMGTETGSPGVTGGKRTEEETGKGVYCRPSTFLLPPLPYVR